MRRDDELRDFLPKYGGISVLGDTKIISIGTTTGARAPIPTTLSLRYARLLFRQTDRFLNAIARVEREGGGRLLVLSFRLGGAVPWLSARDFFSRWLEGRRLASEEWRACGYAIRKDGQAVSGVIAIPERMGTDAFRKPLEAYGFTLEDFRTIDRATVDLVLARRGLDLDSGANGRFCVSLALPTTTRKRSSSAYLHGAGRSLLDRIYLMFVEGMNFHEIARVLNAENLRSLSGRPISFGLVSYLVNFRRVAVGTARTPEPVEKRPRGGMRKQPREPMPTIF